MIGAAIICALVAIAAACLATMAATHHQWIHTLTAAVCAGVALFAGTWFALVGQAAVWPENPATWAALIVLWGLGTVVAGLIVWGVDRTREQEVER